MQLAAIDVLLRRGEYSQALRMLAKLYERDQTDVAVNARIADALFHSERYQEAISMYVWLMGVDEDPRFRERALACEQRLR